MSYDYKKPYYFGLETPLPVVDMFDVNGKRTGLPSVAFSAVALTGPEQWLSIELRNDGVIEYHSLH